MAADGIKELHLTLVEASNVYPMHLVLPETETGGTISVRHAAIEIEKLTKIEKWNQRIIFKGRELSDMNCTLSLLGIKDGCQIHVLKKQYDPDVVKPGYQIDMLERHLRDQDKHLNCLIHRFDVMQRESIPGLCNHQAIVDLLCVVKDCQEAYSSLCDQLEAVSTCEKSLIKKKEHLLCRIGKKLTHSRSLEIGLNDVIVRSTF